MKILKIALLFLVLVIFIGLVINECEAAKKPKPAGLQIAQFVKAYQNGQPIDIGEGVSLYVVSWRRVDKGKNYEFAFNFRVDSELDGVIGVSLYVFSNQPSPLVQIGNYENGNQWTSIVAYEPEAAGQIVQEHGGPDQFYGLNYSWLMGASFLEGVHDLGLLKLKTSAKPANRLKFVVETYVFNSSYPFYLEFSEGLK